MPLEGGQPLRGRAEPQLPNQQAPLPQRPHGTRPVQTSPPPQAQPAGHQGPRSLRRSSTCFQSQLPQPPPVARGVGGPERGLPAALADRWQHAQKSKAAAPGAWGVQGADAASGTLPKACACVSQVWWLGPGSSRSLRGEDLLPAECVPRTPGRSVCGGEGRGEYGRGRRPVSATKRTAQWRPVPESRS